jgi:dolichol-phosphate mannosyltransferase
VDRVLDEVRRYSRHTLVVDDGSTDATPQRLAARDEIQVVTHGSNRGYGAALRSAFAFAAQQGYQYLVTIDCDGQHEPQRIPQFVRACRDVDIVSGSRYLQTFPGATPAPPDRRQINHQLTAQLNRCLGLRLTDAFCGFKAYRVDALQRLELTEDGYAMPLEFWVQAVAKQLKIVELPVPLIYFEEERSFGGALDDAAARLRHYQAVFQRSITTAQLDRGWAASSVCGEACG